MKKQWMLLVFVGAIILSACQKDPLEVVDEMIEITAEDTILLKGTFKDEVHPTSGEVKVVQLANGSRQLQFVNLQSDAGPDLRFYMSIDRDDNDFVEVSNSVKNGTYTVEIPATVDLNKHTNVLIWCKRFSVLFGSAVLE